MKDAFLLSYGDRPKPVFPAHQRRQLELERYPVAVLDRRSAKFTEPNGPKRRHGTS